MKKNRKRIAFAATVSMLALAGCELIVDFDRTTIPGEVVATADGSVVDASSTGDAADDASDGSLDATATDATTADASDGQAPDAAVDASEDAGIVDAAVDG